MVADMQLPALTHQETRSYALVLLYPGGDDAQMLRDRYRLYRQRLRFDIQLVQESQPYQGGRARLRPPADTIKHVS